MSAGRGFAPAVVRDFIVLGVAGGVLGSVLFGMGIGFSFLAACLWLALNFTALAWLLGAAVSGERHPRWFILALVCAKIPASYLILYWLYRAEYLEPLGLSAGLAALPVVLLFRALVTQVGSPRKLTQDNQA